MDPSHPDYAYHQITRAAYRLADNLLGLFLLAVVGFWVLAGLISLVPEPKTLDTTECVSHYANIQAATINYQYDPNSCDKNDPYWLTHTKTYNA